MGRGAIGQYDLILLLWLAAVGSVGFGIWWSSSHSHRNSRALSDAAQHDPASWSLFLEPAVTPSALGGDTSPDPIADRARELRRIDAEIAAKTRALEALNIEGAPASLATLPAVPALPALAWSDPPDDDVATPSRGVAEPARATMTEPAAIVPGPAGGAGSKGDGKTGAEKDDNGTDEGGQAGPGDKETAPTPIVLLLSNRVDYATQTVQALAASVADAKRAGAKEPVQIACVIVYLIPGRFGDSRGAVEAALPGWAGTLGATCDTTTAIDGSTLHQCHDPGASLKLNIWMRCAWFMLMGSLFEHTFAGYDGDVMFLEDDCVVEIDAVSLMLELGRLRRVDPAARVASYSTASGWSGENTANADPATVVVRHSLYFQAMFYAFNRSFVATFLQPYIQETAEKVDHDTNCHGIPDWSECLARQGWRKCFPMKPIVPTLGRLTHIGQHGMGVGGDAKIARKLYKQAKPTAAKLRQFQANTDRTQASYRLGTNCVLDTYGLQCAEAAACADRCECEAFEKAGCPNFATRFPGPKRFTLVSDPAALKQCKPRDGA